MPATILRFSRLFSIAAGVLSLTAMPPVLAGEPLPAMFQGGFSEPQQQAESALPEERVWLELDGFQQVETTDASAHNDLLQDLRQGFALPPVMNDRVRAQLKWFVRNPQYLDRVLRRAQRYLPYITDQIEARGLPFELALLPIVESAYDPFAYSHGRAAGLWQIIPGTARRFGIRQNWWYDGRRDVVDSTRGALEYLAALHELMEGDWLLAVASYNSGEGNVLRAVKRNRAKGRSADFWSLNLSRETESYVPKLLALVEIVREPNAFGLALPEIVREPQFVASDIETQLDLALAAELAGIELDTLYAYNAGLNRWSTDPGGPHRLILPFEVAEPFAAALRAVPAKERVRWQRHKVRSGEAISQIAEQYGTTLVAIRSANNLRGNTIRAGSYLMIPVASKPLGAYSLSADQRRATTQNRERPGSRIEHVVAAGESFWTIGQRYGASARQLAAWNGMAPRDTLSVGQTLVVWAGDATPPATAPMGKAATRKLRYTVRNGDSLSLIASRFRVSVSDLTRWNKIDKNNILRPGQKLTMYVDVTRQSS